jgi:RNA polymerase sigma-70 factor, ECF subfamily
MVCNVMFCEKSNAPNKYAWYNEPIRNSGSERMFLLFGAEEPEPMEERWEWLMSNITPDMERALKREAYRILNNTADVQDVMQEVLIKAVMNCNQLRDKRKVFQWLFTITRHEAYAHISKFSFAALLSRARLLTGLFDPYVEMGGQIASHDDMLLLQKALEELDEDSRRIVVMKSTTKDTLKTIALKLGLNYHTVRSKYQRALHVLRSRLKEGERDE